MAQDQRAGGVGFDGMAVVITADDVNDALAVPGAAGVAIHWHAVVKGSEVVY